MPRTIEISPVAVQKKFAGKSYQIKTIVESPVAVHPEVRKGGIRKNNQLSQNSNRRKMTVPVAESFKEIQDMNDKALKIMAKRA